MADYIKSLKLTHSEYHAIRKKMIDEHGEKIKIPFICKRELGFIPREFNEWTATTDKYGRHHNISVVVIYLDFYSESAKSMFLLKYR